MAKRPKKTPTGNYPVGYARPPAHTQFQKGQPRPPRKPKEEVELTVDDYIAEELKELMTFTDEQGRARRLPKGRVAAKAAVNKAIKTGDLRRIRDHLPKRQAAEAMPFTEADLALIARFLGSWQADEGGEQ